MSSRTPFKTGRPATMARNGLISTSHYLASAAGNDILQRGGSAVDAAIAANAVLCVAYPHMAGLGGDCFWLIWSQDGQELLALNGSGRSAGAATIDFYREQGYDKIPSKGFLAANTVPGAVDGWFEAHQKLGRLEWRRLFERAIQYAEQGVPVSVSLAKWLQQDRDILAECGCSKRTFLPNGEPPRLGEVLVQKHLGQSLRLIAGGGRDPFYKGPIARELASYLGANGGLLTEEDFAAHRSEWVEPIKTSYRGVEVYTLPPNSQGLAVLLILNLIEGFDIGASSHLTADYLHIIVEATKLAFADRDRWVADPQFVQAPLKELLAKDYAERRSERIDSGRALRPGDVEPGPVAVPGGYDPDDSDPPRGDTIHLCVVDSEGNAVSLIESIYHPFGCGVVGGETGIVLQNRGSFFSLDPKHVNRLEPHKRPFHTLMPSMMLRNERPYVTFGTMGGEGQAQTQAALITRLIDFGCDPQEAIEAPRWLYGRAWGDEETTLKLEGRFGDDVVDELRRRGHQVEVVDDWAEAMGHAQVIKIDQVTGVLTGGADPRGDGAAMGW